MSRAGTRVAEEEEEGQLGGRIAVSTGVGGGRAGRQSQNK